MNTIAKQENKDIPIGIFVQKFMEFNFDYLSTEESVFFNYLVVKGQAFKFKEFFHSSETIFNETGIKRKSLESIIKRFEELGIIKVVIKGMPKVKFFGVNYEKISELVPRIYRIDGMDSQLEHKYKLSVQRSRLIVQFYKLLAEKYWEKNINKSIKKEILKENDDVASDGKETFIINFKKFLNTLKEQNKYSETKMRHNDEQAYRASLVYSEETIFRYLEKYLKVGWNVGVISFFKPYKYDETKLEYIEQEKESERKRTGRLIEKLNELYNSRRKFLGMGIAYAETGLPVNNSIRKMIENVLLVKNETEIQNAFIAYSDAVIKKEIKARKFLPLFFYCKNGDYPVIDEYLDFFNMDYAVTNQMQ
jgi:hypothetical protein